MVNLNFELEVILLERVIKRHFLHEQLVIDLDNILYFPMLRTITWNIRDNLKTNMK